VNADRVKVLYDYLKDYGIVHEYRDCSGKVCFFFFPYEKLTLRFTNGDLYPFYKCYVVNGKYLYSDEIKPIGRKKRAALPKICPSTVALASSGRLVQLDVSNIAKGYKSVSPVNRRLPIGQFI